MKSLRVGIKVGLASRILLCGLELDQSGREASVSTTNVIELEKVFVT